MAVRNNSEVSYDLDRVERLFIDLLAQAEAGSRTADTSPVCPVPLGDLLPVEEYTPLQEDLPATYGVGHSELPESAGPTRHAAVRQLQGYLLLFEQLLADVTAQLGNINRFFSADAGENTTYFTRPLFDLPGVPDALEAISTGRQLDGIRGRPRTIRSPAPSTMPRKAGPTCSTGATGCSITCWPARVKTRSRWGRNCTGGHRRSLLLSPMSISSGNASPRRRDAANARLIRVKAALLRDAPELNAFRLLATSNPLWRDAALVRLESTPTGFRWYLALDGQDRLRSMGTFQTIAAASIAAENALWFAARASLYTVVHVGGGFRRVRLSDGTSAVAQVLAESPQTFPSVAAATAASVEIAAAFAKLRLEFSLAPLERRIAYLTGIRSQQRRRLLTATNVHFEIVDDPPGGGLFGKRWRLHELPGNSGQVLLNSPVRFDAATDAAAIELAQQSIRQVLRYGLDEWNYVISPAPGNTFTYELKDSSGTTTIAIRDTGLPSTADAERALAATLELLYATTAPRGSRSSNICCCGREGPNRRRATCSCHCQKER